MAKDRNKETVLQRAIRENPTPLQLGVKKRHDAIVAKNNIAREIANYIVTGHISATRILQDLQEIEDFIGRVKKEPTIFDIMEINTDKNSKFKL